LPRPSSPDREFDAGEACGEVAVTVGVGGALGTTGGALAGGVEVAAGTKPVAVGVLTAGAELLTVVVAARPPFPECVWAGGVGTGGASRLPAETGSEERPMC